MCWYGERFQRRLRQTNKTIVYWQCVFFFIFFFLEFRPTWFTILRFVFSHDHKYIYVIYLYTKHVRTYIIYSVSVIQYFNNIRLDIYMRASAKRQTAATELFIGPKTTTKTSQNPNPTISLKTSLGGGGGVENGNTVTLSCQNTLRQTIYYDVRHYNNLILCWWLYIILLQLQHIHTHNIYYDNIIISL